MKPMQNLLYRTVSGHALQDVLRQPPDPIRLLLCFAACGTAAGALLCRTDPQTAASLLLSQGMALSDELRSLRDVLITALCPVLILLTGIWLSGCAAFGQPAVLLLLFSRGTAFGIAVSACFSAYPVRDAFCIAAILILPYGFCSILLLAYAARDALLLSNRMTHYLLTGCGEPQTVTEGHDRLTNMLGCLLLTLVTAAIHTLLLWQLNDCLLA